jgi:hypothetical protein
METPQLQKCYEYLSELFEMTNDLKEKEAIIKIKDLIIRYKSYRKTFENTFKNHTPSFDGKQINKTGGKLNGNCKNKNRKKENL